MICLRLRMMNKMAKGKEENIYMKKHKCPNCGYGWRNRNPYEFKTRDDYIFKCANCPIEICWNCSISQGLSYDEPQYCYDCAMEKGI